MGGIGALSNGSASEQSEHLSRSNGEWHSRRRLADCFKCASFQEGRTTDDEDEDLDGAPCDIDGIPIEDTERNVTNNSLSLLPCRSIMLSIDANL